MQNIPVSASARKARNERSTMSTFGKRTEPPLTPKPGSYRAPQVESRIAPLAQAPSQSPETPIPVPPQNPAAPAAAPASPCSHDNSEPGPELRSSPRARVFKGAVISYDDHHFTIPCTVRNISEEGALLQILEKLIVPDTFVLLIELDSVETDCEVVWRHEDNIGVKFLSPLRSVKRARAQTVSESNPQHNSPLRRHPVR